MSEPITDPRANELIPAYVAGTEAWRLRKDLHHAAIVWEGIAKSHRDPDIRQAASATSVLLFRAVNLSNATGPPLPVERPSWWRRVLLALL
jgi:hypothetical protein